MTGDGSPTNDHCSCQTGDRKRTSERDYCGPGWCKVRRAWNAKAVVGPSEFSAARAVDCRESLRPIETEPLLRLNA